MKVLIALLGTLGVLSGSFLARAEMSKGEGATPPASVEQATLPLSKVVLYSSGVGYFQHDGTVHGRARIDLRFKADQVNDLLKSMVVQDLSGGQVSAVTYGSRDPITKTLAGFGINLTGNPGLGQILDQIRGERIEVTTPNTVIGIIVGVEKKEQAVGIVEDLRRPVVQVEYLNLLTEDGLRSIPLSQIQRIKLLNDRLNQDLQQALSVLAAGHDTQKKGVSITFNGEGTRNVRLIYIVETPVWKTAYRLVLEDERPSFLQGWSIVENNSEVNWSDVHLSLVSGRPISFTMDLYQPLYATRPVVTPELYASLRPRVYGEAMDERAVEEAYAPEAEKLMADAGKNARGLAKAKRESMLSRADAGPAAPESKAQINLQQGVLSDAQGHATGELFEYSMQTPVTLGRETSAMLPIIGQTVEGQKVSIYNQASHAKHPLNGFRLKNTTPLYLMQGPMTVFDGGAYAGDARIEDLAPGQDRLISYALDLKTEVEPKTEAGQQELVSVSLRKGVLTATERVMEEKTYQIRNRDQRNKVVLIEHPFRSDWQLTEPSQPAERTREVYRFSVSVDSGKSASLRVREEKQIRQIVQLISSGSDVIAYYLQAKQISPKVKEALQRVTSLRDRLGQTTGRRTGLEQRTREITQEQTRIRENMGKLPQNSDLYTRYVKKLDQQETEIDKLRKEIETLKSAEEEQKRELNDYLLGLDLT
jgi:hypothetical protein